MSQVINIDGRDFAVELKWKSLMGREPINRKIGRAAKKAKGSRYARHVVNQNTRGLVAEDDIYGFYIGKAPKAQKRANKVYALASVFARAADAHALWIVGIDQDKHLVIGSKNGNPILDEVHPRGALLAAVARYYESVDKDSARYYLSGIVDAELEKSLAASYGEPGDAPATFTANDDLARLNAIPSGAGILPLVGIGILAVSAVFGYDWYAEEQARIEAAKHIQTPEQGYRVSRDGVLASTALVPSSSFINAMRSHALWTDQTEPTGWQLKAIECGASIDMVACTRTWKRHGGTFDDLVNFVGKSIDAQSLEEANDSLMIPVSSLKLDALTGIANEAEVQRRWGGELQRLKDISSYATRKSTYAREKNASVIPEMGKAQLIGQWPGSAPPKSSPDLIKAGEWTAQGGAAWIGDIEKLPQQFLMRQFLVTPEGGGTFKISGVYLIRP